MTKEGSDEDQLSSDEGIDKVKLRKQRNEREEEERLMLGYSVATAIVPKQRQH